MMTRGTIVAALTVLALGACDDGRGPVDVEDPVVASVTVTGSTLALEAGSSVQLTATARSASGGVLSGRAVRWAGDDSTVARVGTSGLVTGLRRGAVVVEATVEGRRGSVQVEVTTNPLPVLQSIVPATVTAGSPALTLSLRGTGFVPGARVLWKGDARAATWVHAGELKVQVAAEELAEAGDAPVRIVNDGPGGGESVTLTFAVRAVPVAWIEVSPADGSVEVGDSLQLAAVARDSLDRPLEGRTVTWSVEPSGVAAISETGTLRGLAEGTALVTASSEGRGRTVSVGVTPRQAPHITALAPDSLPATSDSLTIAVHGTGFTPASTAFLGSSRPTTYVSPTELRMHFWAGDLATNGVRSIRVREPSTGRWSNTASLLVRGINFVRVEGPPALWTGEASRLVAAGTDQEGTAYPPQPVTWSSSRPEVATVDATGGVRGVSAGVAEISATMTGRTGILPVRVVDPPQYDMIVEAAPGGSPVPELWRVSPGAALQPTRVLPAGTHARTPAVSSDGTRIAWAGGDGQIWVSNLDGTGRRAVTSDSTAKDQPAFSPDGGRLAFRARVGPDTEIGIVSLDGTGQRLLTRVAGRIGPVAQERPTWTLDGSRIVFAHGILLFNPVRRNLLSIRPDGTDVRVLTAEGNDNDPAFSPAGGLLAVARTRNGEAWPRVTLLSPSGVPVALPFHPGEGRGPAWSPDGRWLAYVAPDALGRLADLVITRPNDPLEKRTLGPVANAVWAPRR